MHNAQSIGHAVPWIEGRNIVAETRSSTDSTAQPQLKRAIGRKLLLLFVVGDVLGAGIYAVTGKVAGVTGGAAWLGFGLAFLVALFTATSYAELVGKYPKAAGAALYTQRAFNLRFVTFLVAFTVMCSGLTSATTSAITFGSTGSSGDLLTNADATYLGQFLPPLPAWLIPLIFIAIVTVVNFIGVSESVKLNVILTCIELSGILIVLALAGVGVFGQGKGDVSNAFEFNEGVPMLLIVGGAAVAFFSMVGFEDSVNMVEETKDPQKNFPWALFVGLSFCGVLYMLIAFFATTLVPLDELSEGTAPLLRVVSEAASWFPLKLFALIALCAVANTALINMMMASRLVYGMAEERIIPSVLGRVHPLRRTPWVAILFTVAIVVGLLFYGIANADAISLLASTTSLLLLSVFTVVNIAVLVLRRRTVEHEHFRAPTVLPVLAVVCSLALIVYPALNADTGDDAQYGVALVLLGLGVVLWLVNWLTHGRRSADFDVEKLG